MSDKLRNRAIDSIYQYLTYSRKYDLTDVPVILHNRCMTIVVRHANVRPLKEVKVYLTVIHDTIQGLRSLRVFFVNDLDVHSKRTQIMVLNNTGQLRKVNFCSDDVLGATLQGIGHISYLNSRKVQTKTPCFMKFKDPCTHQYVYANLQ